MSIPNMGSGWRLLLPARAAGPGTHSPFLIPSLFLPQKLAFLRQSHGRRERSGENVASLFHDTKYKATKFGLFEIVPLILCHHTPPTRQENTTLLSVSFISVVSMPFLYPFPRAFLTAICILFLFIFLSFLFALHECSLLLSRHVFPLLFFAFQIFFTASFHLLFDCHFYVFSLSIRFHPRYISHGNGCLPPLED